MQPCDIIILQVILLLIVQMKKIRLRAIKLRAQHQSILYLVNHFLSKIIFFQCVVVSSKNVILLSRIYVN